MAADPIGLLATADLPARDEHDCAHAERHELVRRDSWRRLPRCSRCGQWIAPPGGEGFGGGEIWCGPCVLRHLLRVASRETR